MTTYDIVFLLAFLFPLAFSPGPGNLFFAATGAKFGLKSTFELSLGYHIATFVVTCSIGLGFNAAIHSVPDVLGYIKIIGAVYVIWLAWRLFSAGRLADQQNAKPANFLDGVLLLALNPKAYVIIALMFTQFLEGNTAIGWVITIAIIFTLNNLMAFTLWTVVGDTLSKRFSSKEQARYLNGFFGAILALVGFWMLIS